MSGLVNADQTVIDALDIRLEPKFTSDIVPVGLNKDGSLSKRGSQWQMKQRFINSSNITKRIL